MPHARNPLVKKADEEAVFVCFLDNPIMMESIDNKAVFVMFVILTSSKETHLKVLSELAFLCSKTEFQKILEKKTSKTELLAAIKTMLNS
ncbi:MAG: PTS sugar transporter subunit IIA, partial [Treponemataceae bacterium]